MLTGTMGRMVALTSGDISKVFFSALNLCPYPWPSNQFRNNRICSWVPLVVCGGPSTWDLRLQPGIANVYTCGPSLVLGPWTPF